MVTVDQRTIEGGPVLEARSIQLSARNHQPLLQDVSICFRAGEIIAVVCPDEPVQQALISILSGRIPASNGQVLLSGMDLYSQRRLLAGAVSWVEHQNALPLELTLEETLDYAARLRLPASFTSDQRRQRIEQAVDSAGLEAWRKIQVSKQPEELRLRAKIALALLTNPELLFVDGLAIQGEAVREARTLSLLQIVASQGRAVVITNPSNEVLRLANQVLVLLPGGATAWYGPPAEMLDYFSFYTRQLNGDGYQPGLGDMGPILSDPKVGSPQEWAERYRKNPAYQRYAQPPEHISRPAKFNEIAASQFSSNSSSVQQFFIFLSRSARLFSRDRGNLLLALVGPLLLAVLGLLLMNHSLASPASGDPALVTAALALLVFMVMLVSGLVWMRSSLSEQPVYRFERQFNLRTPPYVFSKLWLIGLLSLVQSLVWTLILWFGWSLQGSWMMAAGFFLTLVLAAFVGGILGLLASVLSRTGLSAGLLLVSFLVIQLIFSGAFVPFAQMSIAGRAVAALMPSRYAFEALVSSSGYGSDVANDPCWNQPEAARKALTASQKQSCRCMGPNIIIQCYFPGIRRFASSTGSEPQPVPPIFDTSAGQVPDSPAPKSGESLDEYAREVNAYTTQIESALRSRDTYVESMQQYTSDLAVWQSQQNQAVISAESAIAADYQKFGSIYNADLLSRWLILLGFSVFLSILTMGIQKRKYTV